ncbi:MAG TPA: hypothetical protein VGK59_16330 [Ohtaekwangia sp.]
MWIEWPITFPSLVPTLEAIVQEIRNVTGLDDILLEKNGIVAHPLFKKPQFCIDVSEKPGDIDILMSGSGKINYLFEATIAACENPGGHCDFKIDPLARKKWSDVKDKYEDKKLLNTTDWPDDEWVPHG